ncbi:MAG: hypothetical protein H7A51_19695 [Akkermansiaceae bacterium]|nr:hypothetical protein [Akkermansiaceae bacterium]
MKLLVPLFLAGLTSLAPAQPQPRVTPLTADTFNLDWEGITGRTYFVQYSLDLVAWQFMPVIEPGNGTPLGYGFDCGGERIFLRLKYTDEPTSNPHSDDFDADGISNWDEVRDGGTGTDPLLEDSDADGIRDDGLVYAAVNDPDGAHLTPALAAGLRARWDIQPAPDNTTTYQDTSGNNHPLTRNSLVGTDNAEAVISRSCGLSGGHLSTDSSAMDGLLHFSLSFWMRPEKDSLSGASASLNRTL